MSTRKAIITTMLALAMLAIATAQASAHVTRELTGTFDGSLEGESVGLAVDFETDNVYVVNVKTGTVNIFSSTGGVPTGGVPSQITGLSIGDYGGPHGPIGVAVDNSCYEHQPRLTETTTPTCAEYDPSYGDVYVADDSVVPAAVQKFKLNAGDKYEEVEKIIIQRPNGENENFLSGVAVDSHGNVYMVGSIDSSITEQRASGERVEIIPQTMVGIPYFVAVDSSGDDIYVGNGSEGGSGGEPAGVERFKLGVLGEINEEAFAPLIVPAGLQARPVAVDGSTGSVFVGDGNRVAEYSEAGGEPQLEFGSSEPSGGSLVGVKPVSAIAVNGDTGQVYVANTTKHDIDVFGPVLGPAMIPVEQPAASDLTRTSALLAGTANPEGSGGNYWYEYVPDSEYESGAADPYAQGGRTVTTVLPTTHTDENIERVVLSGLLPGTTYHYRLAVSNASGTVYGPDQAFTTAPATPPTVATGAASEVGATSATLTGSVGPRSLATSYVFEVGTSTSYEGARLFGNAGSSSGEVQAIAALRYLVPGTTYHYRLVATNFDGTSYGQDQSFTTPNVPSPIGQPTAIPLIATPSIAFPSIAGETTGPAKVTTKALTNAQKLKNALKACKKKPKRQRAVCEKQASKKYGKAK